MKEKRMKLKNLMSPKILESIGNLSVPEKHQLKIAYDTLKMPDEVAGVMGGPSKEEAIQIIKKLTGKTPSIKEEFTLEQKAANFWRDAFLKQNGRMSIKDVENLMKLHKSLPVAFKSLSDSNQYGGAYIIKKGNEYIWPGQEDESYSTSTGFTGRGAGRLVWEKK